MRCPNSRRSADEDEPLSAEQAAGWLVEAWETGGPLAPLPPELAPPDRAAGEAVAAALVAALGIPVCGVRMLPGPLVGGRRAMISAPLLEPRMLRAGTPVALATLRHATLSAGVLGVLARRLGDGPAGLRQPASGAGTSRPGASARAGGCGRGCRRPGRAGLRAGG
jgi:hypothetical protein